MTASVSRADTGDRRRWPRQPTAMPIRLHGVDRSGARFSREASTLDISRGGSLVVVREPLPDCESLHLEIPVRELASETELTPLAAPGLQARVARVIDYGRGSMVGLEFQQRPATSAEANPLSVKL